jgi:hypothetical protein
LSKGSGSNRTLEVLKERPAGEDRRDDERSNRTLEVLKVEYRRRIDQTDRRSNRTLEVLKARCHGDGGMRRSCSNRTLEVLKVRGRARTHLSDAVSQYPFVNGGCAKLGVPRLEI